MGGIHTTIVESINNYTGLSPTSLVIITTLMILTYKIVSTMFVAEETTTTTTDDHQQQQLQRKSIKEMKEIIENDMKREPVQLGEITADELKEFDGSNPKKPLLMAIKGQIYDVSRGRMFYGPGGPYAMFAGRDATRALALMSFDPQDLTGDTEGLSESEIEVLEDWELKFIEKYPKVGVLVTDRTADELKPNVVEEDGEKIVESKKVV